MRKKGGRKKKHVRAAGQWQGIIAGRVGRSLGIAIKEMKKGEDAQCEERRVEEGRGWRV